MVMCPLENKGKYLRFTAVTIILFLKIIYYPKIPFKTRNKIKDVIFCTVILHDIDTYIMPVFSKGDKQSTRNAT